MSFTECGYKFTMIIERYANMSDNNLPVYPVESIGTHTQPVITKLLIQN